MSICHCVISPRDIPRASSVVSSGSVLVYYLAPPYGRTSLYEAAAMCTRKVFYHHRCGHRITELTEACGDVECKSVYDDSVITNKYTCIYSTCSFYGQF